MKTEIISKTRTRTSLNSSEMAFQGRNGVALFCFVFIFFTQLSMANSVETLIAPEILSLQDGTQVYAFQRNTYCGDSEIVLSVLKEELNLPFELNRWSLSHVEFSGPKEAFGKTDSHCLAGIKNLNNYLPMYKLLGQFTLHQMKLAAIVDFSGSHFKIKVDLRPFENHEIELTSKYDINFYREF